MNDKRDSVPADGWYHLLRAMVLQARRDLALSAQSIGNPNLPTEVELVEAELFLLWLEDCFSDRR